ncbi:uncharacterized protein LOC111694841 isoform X3 [Eurytemora carolleeae]|uniref:uncharacterized protein LOC111694841 isoform X3 n=1 Tax=Eurytemora carolleeae TaxID=1294199 RepID=UPI000C75FC84|nr:uncharacterized protein LOC111694841 isoform X3 [Eurytemora carolleeae]|eukprot:XP_023319644.1 uncharacterized protein LOC111694841 isoform X3 [Eurytemora affinis]
MDFNEVPDFDPIEAYSMSIDESTSRSLNLTPTNLQEGAYNESTNPTGVIDLGSIKTAGLSLTPVCPPTNLYITEPNLSEYFSTHPQQYDQTQYLNLPEERVRSSVLSPNSSPSISPQKSPNPSYSRMQYPPEYQYYPESGRVPALPPTYQEYLHEKQVGQSHFLRQDPSQGFLHPGQVQAPLQNMLLVPGSTQSSAPKFSKVVSGDKTIVYSQSLPPPGYPPPNSPPGPSSSYISVSPGSTPNISPNSSFSLSPSPSKKTGGTSPKPSPKKGQHEVLINQEFADIPGVNLRKGNVEINIYVASLVPYAHPGFQNIDMYAERCLACVVRKLKNNLRGLQVLYRSVKGDEGDQGCVIIPRSKDSRITITRQGGVGAASKRIHPHLALVQIFYNPQAQALNYLEPVASCTSPFVQGSNLVEMCLNPFHYSVVPPTPGNKSPGAARKSPMKPRSNKSVTLSKNPLMDYLKSQGQGVKVEEESDSDFLSDSSDSEDWENKWRSESILPEKSNPSQNDPEELIKKIRFLALKRKEADSERTEAMMKRTEAMVERTDASPKLLEKLRILEDLRCLFKGKIDLSFATKSNQNKPKTKTRKYLAKQRLKYEQSNPDKSAKSITSNITSNSIPNPQNLSLNFDTPLPSRERVKVENENVNMSTDMRSNFEYDGGMINDARQEKDEMMGEDIRIKEERMDEEDEEEFMENENKDELHIQDLLGSIKDSFETDLDMELDTFTHQDQEEFNHEEFQQFSIANTFSISGYTSPSIQDKDESSLPGSDLDLGDLGVQGGLGQSSDALLVGAEEGSPGILENRDTLPCIVSSWSVEGGEDNDNSFLMFDT